MQVITLEEARRLCRQYEGTLRASFAPGEIPPEWEAELAKIPAETALRAVGRFALLKHYYLVRARQLEQPEVEPADAEEAARQLLRREPVEVDLRGRTVGVTSRSYAAMCQIAMHHTRIRLLDVDLARAGALYAETEAKLRARSRRRRGHLRKRLQRLQELHRRLFLELQIQRRALYAHAFTAHGGPARSLEEAPSWWTEVDPAADVLLLTALMAAGPGRYARLGAPSSSRGRKAGGEEDAFGWHSLFASIERQQRIEPASLYDRDLYQLLTWVRAGAPPAPPELED